LLELCVRELTRGFLLELDGLAKSGSMARGFNPVF